MTDRIPKSVASRPRVGTASKIVVTGAVTGLSLGLVGAMTAAQRASNDVATSTAITQAVPTTQPVASDQGVVIRRVVVSTPTAPIEPRNQQGAQPEPAPMPAPAASEQPAAPATESGGS